MPGRPHHTDKFKSCVDQVIAKGETEESAYAICTTSLQDAGEPIFVGAEGMRELHILGATSNVRTEDINGREHLVVDVVALMEGVIHAVNAETPEFVSITSLSKAPESWNGHPCVLGHPSKDGKKISAHDPVVLEKHGFGTLRGGHINGTKLGVQALVDPLRLEALGQQKLLKRLRAGEPVEVSVGAFVTTNDKTGTHNGLKYNAEWVHISPDHLAFLPEGVGACSLAMGCGAHRAAQHLVTAEGFTLKENKAENVIKNIYTLLRGTEIFTVLSGDSLDERIQAVQTAVQDKFSSGMALTQPTSSYAYAQTVFDDRVIVRKDDELWSIPYTVDENGDVVFQGEPTKVEQVYVAASTKYEDCPTCDGSGNKDGNPCPTCDGKGNIRTAAGARHSATDMKMIQDMHDYSLSLGAKCAEPDWKFMTSKLVPEIGEQIMKTLRENGIKEEPPVIEIAADAVDESVKLKAACRCEGEHTMTAEQRTEIVKLLVADKHSGFTAGDEKMLEAATDDRLESFRVASEARAKGEEALRAAAAKPLSAEEWRAAAPSELKTLLDRQAKQDTDLKAELVTALKAAQSEYSEAELSVMPVEELERMARMAKVSTKTDYTGKGIPRVAQVNDREQYAPPDPYAADIKTLQSASKAVN